MVAMTMTPRPPQNAIAHAAGQPPPARRIRRTPAKYSPPASSTTMSTGTSNVQEVRARATVSSGGP